MIPSVYTEFKRFGSDPITEPATYYLREPSGSYRFVPYPVPQEESVRSLLGQVQNLYGKVPAGTLSAMTHEPGSPWSIATKNGTSNEPFLKISNDLIRENFKLKNQNKVL